MDTSIVLKATMLASVAHAQQRRKYTGELYIVHPLSVATIVSKLEGATTEMVCAAVLHDVLEDTDIPHMYLSSQMGPKVTHLVEELTDAYADHSLGNRQQRKAMERERYNTVSNEAKTIKLADMIDNAGSIVQHDPGFARLYLEEFEQLLEVLKEGGDVALYEVAHRVVRESKQQLSERGVEHAD